MKKQTTIDIDQLAKLTRLTISSQEKPLLQKQLEETVKYIRVLDQLNTQKTVATAQVTRLKNVSRQDKVVETSFPKKSDYFVTKRIKWE